LRHKSSGLSLVLVFVPWWLQGLCSYREFFCCLNSWTNSGCTYLYVHTCTSMYMLVNRFQYIQSPWGSVFANQVNEMNIAKNDIVKDITICAIRNVFCHVQRKKCNCTTFFDGIHTMIHDTQYTIDNTWYTIHNTRYTIHNTQYTIHNTKYTIHNTQYTIHNTWYAMHDTRYTIRDTWYAIHDTRYTICTQYTIHDTQYMRVVMQDEREPERCVVKQKKGWHQMKVCFDHF
jgi:hypothetical protein